MNLEAGAGVKVHVPGSDDLDALQDELHDLAWQQVAAVEAVAEANAALRAEHARITRHLTAGFAAITEALAPLEELRRHAIEQFAAVTEAADTYRRRWAEAFARVAAGDILRTARRRVRSLGRRLRRRTVTAVRFVRSTLRAVWPGRRRPAGPPTRRTRSDLEPVVARCQRPRAARTLAPTAPAVMYGRTFSPNAPPHRRPTHSLVGRAGST